MLNTLVVFLSLGVVVLVVVIVTLLPLVIGRLFLNQVIDGTGIPDAWHRNSALPFV